MKNFRIAFIPIARTTFDLPYAREMTNAAKTTLSSAGVDFAGPSDLITDAQGVKGALRDLDGAEIDLAIIFQATFADSSMAVELAEKLNAPVFLWAVPEPSTGGRLRLNSFCGINLAGHALTRAGIFYGHQYSAPDDVSIIENIAAFARAGRAQRILRSAQLGRVGENPGGFETCLFDPDLIKKRFGLEILQLDLKEDLFSKVRTVDPAAIEPIKEELDRKVENLDEMDADAVQGSLGTYHVLKEISREKDIQAYAVRCWPEFFTELGCAACGAMSMLSDEMIPCSCEADVNGTITQLILQSISGSQAFGTDMVSIDEERDALVLWHCGLAPLSMADPQFEKRVTIHSNRQLPLLMEFTLKPGPVTFARLSEAQGEYSLVIGEGEIIRAPKSFSGTSGLLKFDQPALNVLNQILEQGLEHHISMTYGNYRKELEVFSAMFDLPVVQIN